MDEEDGYRVSYLGPEGTFSEDAAYLAFRGKKAVLVPFGTILSAAETISNDIARFAVIPCENSLEGSVNVVTDFLVTHPNIRIAGEINLPVRQNLIAIRKIPLSAVRVVVSHPQALAQSRKWLRGNLGEHTEIECPSTAYAIANLTKFGDPKHAVAIGTVRASQLYNRVVLAADIQGSTNNTTRFWILGTRDSIPTKKDKTVILFLGVDNISRFISFLGSLSRKYKVEIVRAESRPTKKGLGSYYFLVEIIGHRLDKKVKRFLDLMKQRQPYSKIRAVGSFPSISANSQ